MKHTSQPVAAVPAIPDDNAPLPPARWPTRWTVRRGRAIAFVCVGLAVALSLIATYVAWRSAEAADARAVEVEQRLATLEEYVQGRGAYRDAEAERLQQQIIEGLCDLLDQLPASPLLDVPRQKYGCGPGTTASPEPPSPAVPEDQSGGPGEVASETAPSTSSPAVSPPPARAPAPQQPAPGAPPTATPPTPRPPSDLDPITDPLCAVLGVCI